MLASSHMWTKSVDRGASSLTSPIATPAAPASAPAPPAPQRGTASIGKTIQIRGEIYAEEELMVDGDVEGVIEVRNKLTVGPNGKLKATVKAKEVVVSGLVDGDIEASDRISIQNGARITGDLKTASIVIDDGAYFKGGIDIIRTDEPKVLKPALV
jgi:cytoskeletal protein CcmA (bactofilin family)